MNKKFAHIGLLFFDVIGLSCLWAGYFVLVRILEEISINAETIEYGNRVGFLMVGILMPLLHFVITIEHFWPEFVKKHMRILSQTLIFTLVGLITAGFASSIWINAKVENAGYVYCSEASGISALAKNLIYARDMEICDALVATKKVRLNR